MGLVVTGLAQSADTAAVEKALHDAALPLDPLTVFTGDDAKEDHAESGVRFIYTGTDSSQNILGSESLITSMGGAEVPGLEPSAQPEFFGDESIEDSLSELEIPDSELEGYVEAIETGRSLLAYYARPETVATVEEAFRAAGLTKVRTY